MRQLSRRSVLAIPAGLWLASPAVSAPPGVGERLAAAALKQIGVTRSFDPNYHKIGYPGGDVPRSTGVCADVAVRSVRDALGLDLQKLVHEDMVHAFASYPSKRPGA